MEVGTVADWVGSLSGLLAVIATLIAWRTSNTHYRLEKSKAELAERRYAELQQKQVFAMFLEDEDSKWDPLLINASDKAVTDVRLETTVNKENVEVITVAYLPPGAYVFKVSLKESRSFREMHTIDLKAGDATLVYRPGGLARIVSFSFVDAEGRKWEKDGFGQTADVH